MIRTQISVDEALYQQARELARKKGISLAELVRRSLARTIAGEASEKPWMGFAGVLSGEPGDSESVDAVVHGREQP